MDKKSLIDYGYDVLSGSNEPMKFLDLFAKTLELAGLTLDDAEMKRRMSKFYTQLSTDERFLIQDDKRWDLSARYVFKQIHNDDYAGADDTPDVTDKEEQMELAQEIGEQIEEPEASESDDLDFDKPVKDSDDEDDDF